MRVLSRDRPGMDSEEYIYPQPDGARWGHIFGWRVGYPSCRRLVYSLFGQVVDVGRSGHLFVSEETWHPQSFKQAAEGPPGSFRRLRGFNKIPNSPYLSSSSIHCHWT